MPAKSSRLQDHLALDERYRTAIHQHSMSTKFIVKIEKNGLIMEVEVNALNANEAKQTALR